jgi:hypothetical protein
MDEDGEYEVIPTGLNEDGDPITHNANGFCFDDPLCPCHEDSTLIGEVNQAYQDGLLTASEATEVTRGRTL